MKWAPMLSPKAKGLDGQKIRPYSPNLRGILGEDFFRIAVLMKSRRGHGNNLRARWRTPLIQRRLWPAAYRHGPLWIGALFHLPLSYDQWTELQQMFDLRQSSCRMSVLILALVSLNSRVLAQTSGSIYGTVTDDSGAVISGAVVVVTNLHTSVSKRLMTDASGDYQFPVLNPGDYEVYASAPEFQAQTQEAVRLDANQNVHVSFALKVGSPEQTMTVEAHTALVDTRESQIGETVDQKRIQDLPLNGRNAYDLLQVIPGVTNYIPDVATGSRVATQITVNGLSLNTDFYLDGAYNTDAQLGGNLLPNPDALQEFRVLTGNFDAEFGHLAGAVVNAITRSGTSQFHALAFDYLRNDVLNAKNWFLTSVTPLRQNQFGGNAGGPIPITHGQDFFFLSYQGLRTRQPATVASSSLITPTILERKGDFRSTPAPFRPNVSCLGIQYLICPDLLDPVAQNLLEFVPVGDVVSWK